jgi:ABC-type branched-subunit amino acid transport system substrate-binding protein
MIKGLSGSVKMISIPLIILSICLLFWGCQKKKDVIKIGIAGPITGDQAKMGMDFKNGVLLAVEEWNSMVLLER